MSNSKIGRTVFSKEDEITTPNQEQENVHDVVLHRLSLMSDRKSRKYGWKQPINVRPRRSR